MVARRITAGALAGAVLLLLTACESSQTKSARLRKAGATAAKLTTVKAGMKNADVKVKGTTILSSPNGTALIVELHNTGTADQAAIPVQVQAKDAKGKVVYKNDLTGLQPSLQQLALLRKGKTAFWINDQVTAPKTPKSAEVAVGDPKGKPAVGAFPKIELTKVKQDADTSGPFLSGVVRNLSKATQVNMPIYGVYRRDGKVVAAGRALIERLNPEPQKRPTVFRIFFIGDTKGAKLTLEAEPTVLRGGRS
jgi:hypothetical protein